MSSCVSATYVVNLKASRHGASNVNLQYVGESGGHVIVLFGAVVLFFDMFPNHVPS